MIKILIVDDHAVVRAGIRLFLEHAKDIKVVAEADDGEQAQALIQEHHPDVAVLDIQMPKATGIDVTRWVRANARETGVLILTAYNDDPYVIAVLQAGANGYVLKTASPLEIIQAQGLKGKRILALLARSLGLAVPGETVKLPQLLARFDPLRLPRPPQPGDRARRDFVEDGLLLPLFELRKNERPRCIVIGRERHEPTWFERDPTHQP